MDPPFLAAGLLQNLVLYFLPVYRLHAPQEPQDPQLPLTGPEKLQLIFKKELTLKRIITFERH